VITKLGGTDTQKKVDQKVDQSSHKEKNPKYINYLGLFDGGAKGIV
jgi:hypothetical protein